MSESSAFTATATVTPDSMIDHFKVVRMVGRGGMGEVYLARDTKLGRKVALKVIHPRYLESREAAERFLLEAKLTAGFSHPHIVTVYAVGEHAGRPYLAMEYLEGQNLRQRISEERPAVREALRIGLAIAKGLAEAHRNGVCHRDLKPENVLLAKDGRLRVLDLGLARMATDPTAKGTESSESHQRHPGAPNRLDQTSREAPSAGDARIGSSSLGSLAGIQGTPAYLAPERWLGDSGTEAADVWALGVIIFELLEGRRPFPQSGAEELQAAVTQPGAAPRLSPSKEVTVEVSSLVGRCLEKNPQDRPTASVVVEALERLVYEKPRLSAQQSPFRGLFPFSERHADFFHGREAEIEAFLEGMREQPLLPVVGPSGAGKSSFVQAGVIPRLREQGPWVVVAMRPGSDPFLALARTLAQGENVLEEESTIASVHSTDLRPREPIASPSTTSITAAGEHGLPGQSLAAQLRESPRQLGLLLQQTAAERRSRVLLLVDQLEELYTLVESEEERARFMEAVCGAGDDVYSPVRVVATIRDDFLGRIAESSAVGSALGRVAVLKRPDAPTLTEILTKPLAAVGYRYEDDDMVNDMVAAVADEPACLPLLQFACQQLWERRDSERKVLLRSAYSAMGGVAGSLAQHADGVLAGMAPSQVAVARQLLLRLVTAEGTRKVLPLAAALEGLGTNGTDVLGRLIRARLLTVQRGSTGGEGGSWAVLELVHESLTRTWGRLARWLEESKDEVAFLAEAGQAAELWEKRGRHTEEVWRGEALAEARRALERCQTNVPRLVADFLGAGLALMQRQQQRRRILAGSGIAMLALVTLSAVLIAGKMAQQRNHAEQQQRLAETERAEAQRHG
ncbi:MAG: serine/threonine-protein kinase, partial [Pseudomonadota bacterium]